MADNVEHSRLVLGLAQGIHALTVGAAAVLIGTISFFFAASAGLHTADGSKVVTWICWALPWLVLFTAGWGTWKNLSYRILIPVLVLSGVFLIYLGWDDTARISGPVMSNLVADDSNSYATFRWALTNDPKSRLGESAKDLDKLPVFPIDRQGWAKVATDHRSEFEKAWASDSLGRTWTEAMATYTPEGIFPPPTSNGAVPSFRFLRGSMKARWGMAQLLLADGKADEAAELLLPLLRAYYHVQQAGTSLVTQMIAVVCIKGTYSHLDSILESNKLSPATQIEVARVLREAPSVALGIQNAFSGEHYFFRTEMDKLRNNTSEVFKTLKQTEGNDSALQAIPYVKNRLLMSFLFNPNLAEKEYDHFLTDACLLGQKRQWEPTDFSGKVFEETFSAWPLKNPVGRSLTFRVHPTFGKVFENFWKAEDLRVALLQRFSQSL